MACLACGGPVTATGVCETCDADQKEIVSQPNDPATLVLELASDRQRLLYRFKRAWRDGTQSTSKRTCNIVAELAADAIFALEAAAPHVVRASDEYGLVASGTVHYHTIAPISFAFSGGMTVSVKSGPEVKFPTFALRTTAWRRIAGGDI